MADRAPWWAWLGLALPPRDEPSVGEIDSPADQGCESTDAPTPTEAERSSWHGWGAYLAISRRLEVAVFGVAPLWILYEILRMQLAPLERNGAEALVTDSTALLGDHALDVLRALLFCAVAISAAKVLSDNTPWARIALISAGEGVVYGVLLGPVTGALTLEFVDAYALGVRPAFSADLVGSLGAGVFEEFVFRLGALTLVAFMLGQVCSAFALPSRVALLPAILASALVFSWFHHLGPGGEPLHTDVFVFRAIAGVLLGILFVTRGFAVCVYTHAAYDVLFYMHDARF